MCFYMVGAGNFEIPTLWLKARYSASELRPQKVTTLVTGHDSLSYKMERVGRVELRIIGLEDRWAPLATIYPHVNTLPLWCRLLRRQK